MDLQRPAEKAQALGQKDVQEPSMMPDLSKECVKQGVLSKKDRYFLNTNRICRDHPKLRNTTATKPMVLNTHYTQRSPGRF